jgi:anti-sigma factor ChrR (cupin superfamily)
MKLNADLNQQAVVVSETVRWVSTPLPGVERRMLERNGEEIARATSIVRYAPGSHFSTHTHGGGEEFLVLEGVFSDEHGDYGPGTYVRNPVGSSHSPQSQEGCIIFVKLWQMDPDDQTYVRLDTNELPWQPVEGSGFWVKSLHAYKTEQVALVKLEHRMRLEYHRPGGLEILVLDGVLEHQGNHYSKGTWLRYPPEGDYTFSSEQGCLLYVKTGHLQQVFLPAA